jgi:iron complex outermembrane receptor protein
VTISGVQVYGAKASAYTVVNLDALDVGGFSGTSATSALTNAQIGAPRAVSGTISMGF